MSCGLVIVSALFDSYAAFIVKKEFIRLGKIDLTSLARTLRYLFSFVQSPLVLTAIITFLAAPALWFAALSELDLSVGYPLLIVFHLLFVIFFGLLFLKESITASKVIGIFLLLSSICFLFKADF